jgi:hypothetical protein
MRIERASSKAIKYACENFHYAKKTPSVTIAHAVFEEEQWCGVICYGGGASAKMGQSINLKAGQFVELVRVALNGNQRYTSQCLAASLKRLKKEAPLVKLVVSYADKGQSHRGTIYQATNWKLIEDIDSSGVEYLYKGQWMHDRDRYNWSVDFRTLPKRKKAGKYKYVYFFDKRLEREFTFLPYPKPEQ